MHNGPEFGRVTTHENGIHLYKSKEMPYVSLRQTSDYALLGYATAFLSGVNWILFLPTVYLCLSFPRKISTMRYFCWHAELLPHTEQVVFHKTNLFGAIERQYVSIHNLEKIDSADVQSPLMWDINMFDPDLCFRDASTGEQYVFDKQGFWNKEALEHPLLN